MNTTIKSTININRQYKEQLEYLVKIKKINSITEGINNAISEYLKYMQKKLYEEKMKDAKEDKEFLARTMFSQQAFSEVDKEIEEISNMEDLEW